MFFKLRSDMKKMVLIGYMGSGKSAVASFLSKKHGLNCMDLDSYIESKEGLSINEIFKTKGEVYFRKIETQYLNQLLNENLYQLIALGGGTPCFGKNMELLLAEASVFYLSASIQTLTERLLPEKTKRPLISSLSDKDLPEFIAKHLFERNTYYRQAQTIINVDEKSIEQIATEIEKQSAL